MKFFVGIYLSVTFKKTKKKKNKTTKSDLKLARMTNLGMNVVAYFDNCVEEKKLFRQTQCVLHVKMVISYLGL